MTDFHVLFTALSLTWLYMLAAIVAVSMGVALIAKLVRPRAKGFFLRAQIFALGFGGLFSILFLFLFVIPTVVLNFI